MSEDPTQPTLKTILAALNDIRGELREARDEQRKAIERLGALEARKYDTKPIWENAFKAIADLSMEVREGFADLSAKIEVLNNDVLELRARIVKAAKTEDKDREQLRA